MLWHMKTNLQMVAFQVEQHAVYGITEIAFLRYCTSNCIHAHLPLFL